MKIDNRNARMHIEEEGKKEHKMMSDREMTTINKYATTYCTFLNSSIYIPMKFLKLKYFTTKCEFSPHFTCISMRAFPTIISEKKYTFCYALMDVHTLSKAPILLQEGSMLEKVVESIFTPKLLHYGLARYVFQLDIWYDNLGPSVRKSYIIYVCLGLCLSS